MRQSLRPPRAPRHWRRWRALRLTANRALPYGRVGGPVRGLGPLRALDERDQLGEASTPAGLLAMSANDLTKWLQLQLAHGRSPSGTRVFSDSSAAAMWDPQVIEPQGPQPAGLEGLKALFKAYALGWEVSDYGGERIVMHPGGVFGFITMVVLIPDRDVGFALTMNAEESPVLRGLTYELIDHYLGRPKVDWVARYTRYRDDRLGDALKAVQSSAAAPAKVGPSLPLSSYAGHYVDPWYGRMTIAPGGPSGLTLSFDDTPRMAGPLEHYQYDSFIVRFTDPGIEPAYVTFNIGAAGEVERIKLKPVSPTADFSFDYQDLDFAPVAAASKEAK